MLADMACRPESWNSRKPMVVFPRTNRRKSYEYDGWVATPNEVAVQLEHVAMGDEVIQAIAVSPDLTKKSSRGASVKMILSDSKVITISLENGEMDPPHSFLASPKFSFSIATIASVVAVGLFVSGNFVPLIAFGTGAACFVMMGIAILAINHAVKAGLPE